MNYRKNFISTSGALKLSALFKDLPQSGTTTWDFSGGPKANRYVVSGNIPSNPNYGGGKLENIYLGGVVSGSDVSESSQIPQLTAYKIKDGVLTNEGTGSQLSTAGAGGDSLTIITKHMDNSLPWFSETFNGAEKTIGDVTVIGSPGGGALLGENAYVDADQASNKIYLGGTFSFFHVGEDMEGGTGEFLQTYFGRTEGGGMGSVKERKIYIKPQRRNKPEGLWTTRYDNRTGLNKYTVFKPICKFKDLKSLIFFEKKEKTTTGDEATPQPVSKGNTIFNVQAITTPSISNAWEGNPDGTGWCQSWLELDTSNYASGGQSLKMAHMWDNSAGVAETNSVYGAEGQLNPQFSMVTTDLGPYPVPMDMGGASLTSGMIDTDGHPNISAAQVDIKFKITKMGSAIQISGGTNAPTLADASVSVPTNTTLINMSDGAPSGSTTVTIDSGHNFTDGGVGICNGMVFRYTGTGATTLTGVTGWNKTQPNNAKVADMSVDTTNDLTTARSGLYISPNTTDYKGTTLLRSFVVTWSNAPPEQGDNLDSFLFRTLMGGKPDSSVGSVPTYFDKAGVVGGFAVVADNSRLESTDNDQKAALIAVPLVTDQSWYVYTQKTGSTTSVLGANSARQYYTYNGLHFLVSGDSAATGYGMQRTAIMPYKLEAGENSSYTVNKERISDTLNSSAANADNEPCVRLDYDEWINVKTVFNPYAQKSSVSGDVSDAPFKSNQHRQNVRTGADDDGNIAGPQARCYFTAGVTQPTGTTNVNSTLTGTTDAGADPDARPPSFNLDWSVSPIRGGSQSGRTATSSSRFGEVYESGSQIDMDHSYFISSWPRYMTVWLQNFRYIATGGTDDKKFGTNSAGNSILTGEWPATGGARETEAFVDNITLTGFNGQIYNSSAGAGVLTKPLSIRQYPQYQYFALPTHTSADTSSTWYNEYPDASGEYLPNAVCPTYLAIGFESGTTDMYANSDDFDSWWLWNGFNYGGSFSGLKQQVGSGVTKATTNMWYSTLSGNHANNTVYDSAFTNNLAWMFGGTSHTIASTGPEKRLTPLTSALTISSPTGSIAAPGGIAWGSGSSDGSAWNSVDGMTQKGFTFFKALSGTTSGTAGTNTGMIDQAGNSNWEKIPNVIASARVIGIPSFDLDSEYYGENGKSIIVDEPELFDEATVGTNTYVIYLGSDNNFLTDAKWKSNDSEFQGGTYAGALIGKSMDLKQTRKREGDMIFFDQDVSAIANNTYLPYLWVGPRKYWINMEIWPGQCKAVDTTVVRGATASGPANLYRRLASTGYAWAYGGDSENKVYDNICLMSGNKTGFSFGSGSTYNEWNYGYNASDAATAGKAALYRNTWNLDVGDKASTSLDITTDFGYGTYDVDKDEGGQVDIKSGYTDRPIYLDFSKAIDKGTRPDAPFMSTLQLNKPTANQTIEMFGNDYTRTMTTGNVAAAEDRKPYYMFGYHDELPKVSRFQVYPTIDVTQGDVNLYEMTTENLNSVTFTWDEAGDDIWYRLLMVDNKPIENKYTNCLCWIPFNDLPNLGNGYDPLVGIEDGYGASSIKLFAPSVSGTSNSSTVLADPYGLASASYSRQRIEGINGYGYYSTNTTGSDGTKLSGFPIAHATNGLMNDSTKEYTLMIHLRPAASGAVFFKGDTTTGLNIGLNSAGKIVVSGQDATMTGTSSNPLDGETPLAVMVTYKSGSQMPMTLHINGKLEDYITEGSSMRDFGSTAAAYIGTSTATNSANNNIKGYIEEFCVWNKRLYCPEMPGEYIFDTKELTEYDTGTTGGGEKPTFPHNARLFVMDYTNVRGTSRDTIASSSNVSWRTTIA